MNRGLRIIGERQQAFADALAHDFAQAGLEKGDLTLAETLNALCIHVHANHAVTHVGKNRRLYQAHITTAKDTNSHDLRPCCHKSSPHNIAIL